MTVYRKGCLKEAMKFQNASRLVPRIGQMEKKTYITTRYSVSTQFITQNHFFIRSMSIDQRCRSIVFDKKGIIQKNCRTTDNLIILKGRVLLLLMYVLSTLYYFRFVIMCTMKNDPLLMMTTAAVTFRLRISC